VLDAAATNLKFRNLDKNGNILCMIKWVQGDLKKEESLPQHKFVGQRFLRKSFLQYSEANHRIRLNSNKWSKIYVCSGNVDLKRICLQVSQGRRKWSLLKRSSNDE